MTWATTEHLSLDDDGVLWETLYDRDGEYCGRAYLGRIDDDLAVPGHLAAEWADLERRWRQADETKDRKAETIRTFEHGLF